MSDWQHGPLTKTRYGHVAGTLNGKIIVAGGRTDTEYYANSTELFHSTQPQLGFVTGPRMKEKRLFAAGTGLGGLC